MSNKFRKYLSLMLVCIITLLSCSVCVDAEVIAGAVDNYYDDVFNDECNIYQNIRWKYDELNKELIVGGSGSMPVFVLGNRPWEELADTAEKVTIVGDLTDVGNYAFAEFSALDVLRFMANIVTIRPYAFSNCEKLYTIHMPVSVKTISSNAFQNCTKIWAIHYEGTSSDVSAISFTNNTTIRSKFYYNRYRGTNLVVIENVNTEYEIGEEFYADVYICSSDGKLSSRISNYQVKNFDNNMPGTQIVQVGYNGHFEEFEVNVYGEPIETVPCEIVIDNVKKEYMLGEDFYAEIYRYYEDGDIEERPVENCEIYGYDCWTEGWQTVVVCFEGNEFTFDIYVYPKSDEEYPSGGYENFYWEFNEEMSELTIWGDGYMPDFEYTAPPWEEFSQLADVVTIKGNITNISSYAFRNFNRLYNLYVIGNVETISSYAFEHCGRLRYIYLNDTIYEIQADSFAHGISMTSFYKGNQDSWNTININDNAVVSGKVNYNVILADEKYKLRAGRKLVMNEYQEEYNYGDEFYADISGYLAMPRPNGSGTLINIDIKDCEISGFDSYASGEQYVTISYAGMHLNVTVYVNESSYIEPENEYYVRHYQDTYEYGEEFYIEIAVSSPDTGKEYIVPMDELSIEGFDCWTEGWQTVKVCYKDFEYWCKVYVNCTHSDGSDEIISVDLYYYDNTYYPGDEFYAELMITYADGRTECVNDFVVEGFDSYSPGAQDVVISYMDQLFNVKVKVYSAPDVPEIFVLNCVNLKEEYHVGDDLEIEVFGYTEEGVTVTISLEDCQISGFDSDTAGVKHVIVRYGEHTFEFDVTVYDIDEPTPEPEPSEVVDFRYVKTTYEYGEEFYAEVYVIDANGEQYLAEYSVSGFDSYKPGWQPVTVSYGGYFMDYDVYVNENIDTERYVVSIELVNCEIKYYPGDEFDGDLLLKYSDGTEEITREYKVQGFDSYTPGAQKVAIIYGDTIIYQTVRVYPATEAPQISQLTYADLNTEYYIGDELQVEIVGITSGGNYITISLEECEVVGFDNTTAGDKFVTVTYGGLSVEFVVTVYDDEQGAQIIDVDFEFRRDYEYGEEFSATAVVHYDDGSVIHVKDCKVEGYDPYEPGDQIVTVIYGEYSLTVMVTVGNEQPQVSINNVKTEYEYGEDFYAEVQVCYNGVTTDVYDFTVTGFDSYSPGVQKVTVSYLNYKKVYTVTVNEPVFVEPEIRPVATVNSVKCFDGNTVDVIVSLSNNRGFTNLALEISYDKALVLVGVTPNSEVGATFTKAQSLEVYPYNIGWDAVSDVMFNGDLVTLTFEVPEGLEAGEYFVDVDFYKGRKGDYIDGVSVNYDEDENPLYLEYVNGCVKVFDYIPGDINGDGIVTNKDGTAMLRYLAGWDIYVIEDALDVDGDGVVCSKDGTRLLRYLAGWDVEIY